MTKNKPVITGLSPLIYFSHTYTFILHKLSFKVIYTYTNIQIYILNHKPQTLF